jgi:autotransporter-associated beta strand protein
MNLKSTIRFSIPLASAIAVILATQSTQAQNTWDGGGSNSNWTFSTNWSTDVTPTGTQWQEGIIWAGNVRNDPNNNIATLDLSVGGFSFTNDGSVGASNGFTVSGDRITLVGDITTTAASPAITDTISLAMILNGNRTITTNTSHNLTVSGIISETGVARTLTKAGAATLTLSGANSYSGATNINAGTLSIGNAGALANTSRITIGGASAATLSTSLDGLILTAPITTADTGVTSTIAFSRTTDVAGSITLNEVDC